MELDLQNLGFKILEWQNPEFNILECQNINPEFKILALIHNSTEITIASQPLNYAKIRF